MAPLHCLSGGWVVIIRFKANSVQLDLQTGTELGKIVATNVLASQLPNSDRPQCWILVPKVEKIMKKIIALDDDRMLPIVMIAIFESRWSLERGILFLKTEAFPCLYSNIGTRMWRSSRSAFRRLTGNDVSGHYKRHSFFFIFLRHLLFS